MAIQPRNTTAIKADSLLSKTLATALSLGSAVTSWKFDTSENFVQDATNGGSITLTKASTCVTLGRVVGSISAAGTIITDATDLTGFFNDVTTVAAATGVQLWDSPLNALLVVRSAGANTLKVWPHSGAGTLNGGAAGASVTLAVGSLGLFFRETSTNWIALEFTIAAA